ncbi:MAG: OmpA family protein [Clostridiales bacterium]|jgi:outer membrane protein OmpA-like peptidoglycan-associated protein|nr:OmpA family protein [Clostridiales bacterium]
MKRNILLAVIIFIAAITSSCSAAAGSDFANEKPVAISIVIGRHTNQNKISQDAINELSEIVSSAVYSGYISVVLCDGSPVTLPETFGYLADSVSFPQDARNAQIYEQRKAKYTQKVIDFILDENITKARAQDVDIMSAIFEAARSLARFSDSPEIERKIIIVDSGISTTGTVNFHETNLHGENLEAAAADLIKNNPSAFPNLTGIGFSWLGLGDVAAPQMLKSEEGEKLALFWRSVLRESGAAFEDNDIRVAPKGSEPNLYIENSQAFPFVSTVVFTPPQIDSETGFAAPPAVPEPEIIVVQGDVVAFMPDSAEFIDITDAERKLKTEAEKINQYLLSGKAEKIFIVGSTAKTSPDDNYSASAVELSAKRARKVTEVLVAYGVAENNLEAFGLGPHVPAGQRSDEFASSGVFDETAAQRNRCVLIVADTLPLADILLAERENIKTRG